MLTDPYLDWPPAGDLLEPNGPIAVLVFSVVLAQTLLDCFICPS